MKSLFKSLWVALAAVCFTFTLNAQDEWDGVSNANVMTTTEDIFRTGKVGLNTTLPASNLSINGNGDSRFGIYVTSPGQANGATGIFAEMPAIIGGANSNRAISGSIVSGSGYAIGLQGTSYRPVPINSGRAYGVYAQAGNADINYGLYASLRGNNRGAAVFGTTGDNGSSAVLFNGRWAGYFLGRGYFSEDVGIGTNTSNHRLEVKDNANPNNVLTKFSDSQDQQIFFVPRLGGGGYNWITQQDDAGIFWSDNTNQNNDAGFVISPWKSGWHGTRFAPNGKVHIGGGTTDDKLQVGVGLTKLNIGSAGGQDLNWGTSYIGFNAGRASSGWKFENDGANNGGGVVYTSVGGTMYFVTEKSTGASDKFLADTDIWDRRKMSIDQEGKVAIGHVNTPGNYKLYVEDGILTEHIKVALHGTADWADYVFQEEYDLKTLEEVEAHIEAKGHLHNTPSAATLVADGGVELKAATVNQQEKIEELFLHLIEMNKRLKDLEQENEALKVRLDQQ